MIDKLSNISYRALFIISLVLLLIALLEKFLVLFGWTLFWLPYEPARLLELSAILVIFVIAFLLRQIREKLKS